MLVVSVVYMKVLWNLQEGLREASSGISMEIRNSSGCFFNGRTTEKNWALPIG